MDTMASLDRQTYQSLLDPRPASSQSILVLILPPIIRKRLPMLTSIRHRYMKRSHIVEHKQSDSRPSSSSSADGEVIPYSEWNIASKSATMSQSSSNDSSGTATPRGPDASGINWAMAGAGVRLWLSGRQQLEEDRNADPAVMRSMHIDALKYMHAALPNDLTIAETDTIVGSLPRGVRDELGYRQHMLPENRISESSILRKAVSDSVCSLMAVLIFLLPFLMASFNRLLRYEREHQLSEKALTNGVATVNAFGERGLDFKDSRLGNAVLGTAVWIMDGVVGGFNDGLVRSTGPGRGVMKTSS
jgi:hypothetical protein